MFDAIEVIEMKRDGGELSTAQFSGFIGGYIKGSIPDYQMSALLMAIVWRGMTVGETIELTRAMIASGDVLDLSSIPVQKLDKHSTGGVGDKISLAFVPIVAADGVPIAKMSGRGLGHTGGTLDKLESICGFNVNLSSEQIVEQVRQVGGCLCAQTERLVPADKKIYALRDVTGTVESTPLIAASIMSKKIAGGADIILLDVKVGQGAFMKSVADARELAKQMQTIGKAFGKRVVCELTQMNSPLGQAVGNLIEVKEATDLLRGKPVDPQFKELVLSLSDSALALNGKNMTAQELIDSGSAWNKFVEIVDFQGGDVKSIDRWDDVSPLSVITARQDGYVTEIDAEAIGRLSTKLGAGRMKKDDQIDPLAGVWIEAPLGTFVQSGDVLTKVYGQSNTVAQDYNSIVTDAFVITEVKPNVSPLIIETLN